MPPRKPASKKAHRSHGGPARILGLPLWGGVGAIATLLSLVIAIVLLAWPRSTSNSSATTHHGAASPHLALDTVLVKWKYIERDNLPAFLDQVYFVLRNTGGELAVITGVRLEVQQFARIPECFSSGSLGTTGWTTAGLPANPRRGEVVTVPVSQQLSPDSADKFEVSLHVPKATQGLQIYRLRTWIRYDEQDYLDAGYLVLSLPVEPQDGGYFWSRSDQADPNRLKPFTPDLQSLAHCLISNSELLRGILSQPGARSTGLASILSALAYRY
jgi:hypothetical protein